MTLRLFYSIAWCRRDVKWKLNDSGTTNRMQNLFSGTRWVPSAWHAFMSLTVRKIYFQLYTSEPATLPQSGHHFSNILQTLLCYAYKRGIIASQSCAFFIGSLFTRIAYWIFHNVFIFARNNFYFRLSFCLNVLNMCIFYFAQIVYDKDIHVTDFGCLQRID